MNFVYIPFQQRFQEAMLNGCKTQTARTKRYAREGNRFRAFDATFEVRAVIQQSLRVVRDQWQVEGCASPEEFDEIWKELHPRRGLDLEQIVWVHRFTKVEQP